MRLFDVYLRTRVGLLALVLVFSAAISSQAQDAALSATELLELRKALAEPIEIFSPVLLVEEIEETELILLNRSTAPVEFDVAVIGHLGLELPLGRYQVPEHGYRSLPVAEAIRRSGERVFRQGSLRTRYNLELATGSDQGHCRDRARRRSRRPDQLWTAASRKPPEYLAHTPCRPTGSSAKDRSPASANGPRKQSGFHADSGEYHARES